MNTDPQPWFQSVPANSTPTYPTASYKMLQKKYLSSKRVYTWLDGLYRSCCTAHTKGQKIHPQAGAPTRNPFWRTVLEILMAKLPCSGSHCGSEFIWVGGSYSGYGSPIQAELRICNYLEGWTLIRIQDTDLDPCVKLPHWYLKKYVNASLIRLC